MQKKKKKRKKKKKTCRCPDPGTWDCDLTGNEESADLTKAQAEGALEQAGVTPMYLVPFSSVQLLSRV